MLEDVVENTPELVVVEHTTESVDASEKDSGGMLLLAAYTAGVVALTIGVSYGIGKLRKVISERQEKRFQAKFHKPLTNDGEE